MKACTKSSLLAGLIAILLSPFGCESTEPTIMKVDRPLLPGQKEAFPPATEAEVAKFEVWLGSTLPPRYRNFLLARNGGDFRNALLDLSNIPDGTNRPAPYSQYLQNLRTLALSPSDYVCLYHVDGPMEIIRAEDEILLKIGSTIDRGLIYVYVNTESADQIWMKTPILPNFEGKAYPTEWFFLDDNIDDFLTRLHEGK